MVHISSGSHSGTIKDIKLKFAGCVCPISSGNTAKLDNSERVVYIFKNLFPFSYGMTHFSTYSKLNIINVNAGQPNMMFNQSDITNSILGKHWVKWLNILDQFQNIKKA